MPTTFSNGFQGGNPIVSGAGQHHDETDGRQETMAAAYLNRIEAAIVATQSQLNTVETTVNSVVTVLTSASGAAAGGFLLGPTDVAISGTLPSAL